MGKLAEAVIVRGKKIKNRIVMPPIFCFTFTGDNDGVYGRQHIDHYTQRAKGGTGLIIVQATQVAGAARGQGVWSAAQMKPLEIIAQNCHDCQATVMMQLACGDVDIHELSPAQIHDMQADCVAAAARAEQAGFDGVEYHFAHGFTLCKFLDPTYNHRTDSYGGPLENRMRIFTEMMPEIRKATGPDFIVSVRMGGNIPDLPGAVAVAKAFEAAGVDLLHVSSGMTPPAHEIPADFKGSVIAYNGSAIKKQVKVPVIAVAEIFTGATAEFLVSNGGVDFVAVGRGLLADANWAAKVLAGQPVHQCRNCGGTVGKCSWFVDHTKCAAKLRSP